MCQNELFVLLRMPAPVVIIRSFSSPGFTPLDHIYYNNPTINDKNLCTFKNIEKQFSTVEYFGAFLWAHALLNDKWDVIFQLKINISEKILSGLENKKLVVWYRSACVTYWYLLFEIEFMQTASEHELLIEGRWLWQQNLICCVATEFDLLADKKPKLWWINPRSFAFSFAF